MLLERVINPSDNTGLIALETEIDESGVLDSTDGTVKKKVEQLIDKINHFTYLRGLLRGFTFENRQETPEFIIDCSGFTTMQNAFYQCGSEQRSQATKTIRLTNTGFAGIWRGCFCKCRALETLETLDFTNCIATGDMFIEVKNLVNLKIVPNTLSVGVSIPSPKLSTESIQSIIDGLATVATARNLTLHTDVVLKLTDEQHNQIASKNWNVL